MALERFFSLESPSSGWAFFFSRFDLAHRDPEPVEGVRADGCLSSFGSLLNQLFLVEELKIAARTDLIFQTNPFGLDRDRMMAIAYEHGAQRAREIGLA